MDHMDAMHIFQPIRDIDELSKSDMSVFTGYNKITHELDTISPWMIIYKLVDIAVIHPLGYHRKPVPF